MKRIRVKRLLLVVLSVLLAAAVCAVPALGAANTGVIDVIGGNTLMPVASAPAAPSDLLAYAFPGVLPVGLTWKDNSNNETGFTIERSTNGGDFKKIATVAAGETKYLDSSVTNDMLCRYRVYANGTSIVMSGYSNVSEWLTRPYTPSNLTAHIEEVNGGISLGWGNSNTYATYQIHKTSQVPGQATKSEYIDVGAGEIYYTDKDVVGGGTYSYYVVAWSKTDCTEGSNTVTVNYMERPTEVKVAHFPRSPKLTLMWKDNTDNETKFVVEMAHSSQGPVVTHEVPANTTKFDDDVVLDEWYMYRVKAVAADGNYSPYSEVCHWYSEPNIPQGFAATPVSYSEVKLNWTDLCRYETGFKIWRKGGGEYSWIELAANTTSCSDKGLKPNTEYTYGIFAYNNDKELSETAEAKVTTPAASFITPEDLIQKKTGLIIPGTKLDTVLQIGSPSMTVNGETREIDPGKNTAPVIVEGRTLLPIRAVIEAYGGTVDWDGTARKVTVLCNGKTIELWIDSLETKVDGVNKTTEVAPQIISDRTMLPLRFVSENLGLSVDWDAANQRVTIKTGS